MIGEVDGKLRCRDAAQEYRGQGFAVCRIRPNEKRPTDRAWTTRSADPNDFGPRDNIGLVCGWPSDGGTPGQFLVCVDLDTSDAIEKADQFLPATGAIEGRDGKLRSHWWFLVTTVPDWATSKAEQAAAAAESAGKPAGPFKKPFNHTATGERVIDFQGTGGQAVVPPSIHEGSGETRQWEQGCSMEKIATVPFTELWDAVCRLAEACGAKVPAVGPSALTSETEEEDEAAEAVSEPAAPVGQVQGTCTRECDVPMEERVRRCERYLLKVELAKSGHGGHNLTYRVARIIVNDYCVTNREDALRLMRVYNDRLKGNGEETWSEKEIEHKIASALNARPNPQYLPGRKLPEQARDGTPRAWDDPARLAEGFLCEHTVRFVKQTAFEYRDGVYQVVSNEWLAARVRGFIERAATQEWIRLRGEHQARRSELEDAASAPAPTGNAPADLEAHAASVRRAKADLSKAEKRVPVVPKVAESMVSNALGAIHVRSQLPDATELDAWLTGSGPPVLAVADGLLDPVTRSPQFHTPDWFSTAKLPVAFDQTALAPQKWLAFLADVMEGDAERIAVLQELFGACLDRTYPAKCFAALVGSGDNGKSVALAVLRFLLGAGNCSAVNLDELSNNRFAAFQMFGKLANVVGDQGHFESHDEGRLKTLTGGDLVTFEQKGKDSFVAVNRAKLIFACNTMPTFGDKSEAVWNRMVAVPFDYTVPANKKNPALLTPAYWADELPAILNWALDGLARLHEQGRFTRSAKCEAMKAQTRQDSNPARQFLQDECDYTGDDGHGVNVEALYVAYKIWCSDSGFTRPLTKPKFGREVRAVYPQMSESKVVRDGERTVRRWVGLRLNYVTVVTEPPPAP